MKFKIQNVEFNACIIPQSTLQSTAVSSLMSVPPISHSGRCNYFRWDRAKCHQEFLKATALRHVLLCVFFSFFFFFPSRRLLLSINSAHRLSSAISLQTISLQRSGLELLQGSCWRIPHQRLHTKRERQDVCEPSTLDVVMSARDDVREAFEGSWHKLSDETLLLTGWTVAVSESTTKLNCSRN